MNPGPIANSAASDWFTINPAHRTMERLAEHVQQAIDKAIQVEHTGTFEGMPL